MLQKSLFDLEKQINDVQIDLENDIIDVLTALDKVNILKKEIFEKKKLLIKEVHIGKRGTPLSMGKYNEAKGLYIVKCADGKQVTSITQERLLDAMMQHYGLSLNSPLVKDVFDRALSRYQVKHPDKSKTVYNYLGDYKRFINNAFQKMDVRKITVDFLEDYSLSLICENNLKVKAFTNFKTLLNLIWEQAIREGLTHENITKRVKVTDYTEYCDQSLAHRKPEDVLYKESDLEAIFKDMWARIDRYYAPFAYAVLLHYELGCRPDELICIKWSDINFIEGFISIERQQVEKREPKQSFEVKDYTKNEKGVSKGGRLIPLSTKAVEVLEKLKAKKEELGIESEWLFTDRKGKLKTKKGYFDFIRDTRKKYTFKTHSSYAFRRGLSAKLESKGVAPSERAAILGQSVETNLKHYTFAKPDYLDRVKAAMG